MKVYFAADHAGFDLKSDLLTFVRGELGLQVEDCGAFENDPNDDYPVIIAKAVRKLSVDVASGIESCAILIGASGEGEAMVANRFPSVRCALYYGALGKEQTDESGQTLDILSSTRVHNHANALSLGARFLSLDEAKDAVKRWVSVQFSNDARHLRRVAQIDTVEGDMTAHG